ncbi:hypothetical protein HK100_007584 [Physocladia obscura]|uniref:DUF2423 domain-containing protein n=1 Tax=Physocladia obscura TaxID=109957 RepID=A0AAD5T581_9FUNG|nr:hypothetical protein HK100_007584 [Physocladia obscura]
MVSIRSSKKKHFRAVKREQVFKPVEDARMAAIAKLLHAQPNDNPSLPSAEIADKGSIITADKSNVDAHKNISDENDTGMDDGNDETSTEKPKLTKIQREKIMLSRNQFKKKQRARLDSKHRGKALHGLHKTKTRKKGRFTPI